MSVIQKNRLYAHSMGHTDVCYSSDGKYLLTCGSDGDLRLRLGYDDPDPISQGVDSTCLAIVSHEEKIYCGSTALNIAMYSLPRAERIGVLCRFTAPCTDLSLSADGKFIASGSCDMSVHVTNTITYDDKVFLGHTGPIFGVALDPKCEYVVSSSGDGTVKVWNTGNQTVLKTWYDIAPKCNDFFTAPSLARPTWQSVGRLLAIATLKKVIVVTRGTWDTLIEVDDPKVETWFSVCKFSPCGRMLAACSKNGILSVWNIDMGVLIASESFQRPIPLCGVAWNSKPKKSDEVEISLCDTDGHLTTMVLELPSGNTAPASPVGTITSVTDDTKVTTTYDSDIDDAASVGGDESDVASTTDKIPAALSSYKAVSPRPEHKLQDPFQPSSTPITLMRRFMVYNSVGTVQAYSDDSEEKTIDVEFHNTTVYHNFSISNSHDHTMACLSTAALVLAGETQGMDGGSKIQGMPLQGNTGNQFWTLELVEDEEVIGLAVSEDFIAVATNNQFLRFLTIGGVQREVYSIPGRFLCMTANKNKLMIISHASPAMGSDQNLQFLLINVTMPGVRVEALGPLPTSPDSQLQWCGFSEENIPCTFDSKGVLRAFMDLDIWKVVCSTRALRQANILTLNMKSDHIFVVSVSLSSLVLRCILCKGSRYPHTSPPPTVVPVTMKMPTAEMHTDKGMCEGALVQIRSMCDLLENPSLADELKDQASQQLQVLSKAALKLFALTANQDTIKKTVEIYKLIPSKTLRELTRKYAQQAKKHSLLEILSELEDTVAEDFENAHEDKRSHTSTRNTFAFDAGPQEYQSLKINKDVPTLAPLIPRGNISRKKSSVSKLLSPLATPAEISFRDSTEDRILNTSQLSSGTPDINPFKRSVSLNRSISTRSIHSDVDDSMQNTEESYYAAAEPEVEENSEAEIIESSQMDVTATLPPQTDIEGEEDTQKEQQMIPNGSSEAKNSLLATKGFKNWLTANKSKVIAAHPNLEKKDQIKAALKMFNEEKNKQSSDTIEIKSSENLASRKRLTERETDKNPAKIAKTTANKLQNFFLKRKDNEEL